jgi:sugar lactone lactonase YvrE
MIRIDELDVPKCELGEGPLWDVGEQRLYWIDSHLCRIFRADARGECLASWTVPEHIGSLCPARDRRCRGELAQRVSPFRLRERGLPERRFAE